MLAHGHSPQLTEPLLTDSVLRNGIDASKLITLKKKIKKKKREQTEDDSLNLSTKYLHGKAFSMPVLTAVHV